MMTLARARLIGELAERLAELHVDLCPAWKNQAFKKRFTQRAWVLTVHQRPEGRVILLTDPRKKIRLDPPGAA